MDEGENPAVTQAIMRHAKLDMTLYYSHSQRKQKRAVLDKFAESFFARTGVTTGVGNDHRVVNTDRNVFDMMTLPLFSGRLTQR